MEKGVRGRAQTGEGETRVTAQKKAQDFTHPFFPINLHFLVQGGAFARIAGLG